MAQGTALARVRCPLGAHWGYLPRRSPLSFGMHSILLIRKKWLFTSPKKSVPRLNYGGRLNWGKKGTLENSKLNSVTIRVWEKKRDSWGTLFAQPPNASRRGEPLQNKHLKLHVGNKHSNLKRCFLITAMRLHRNIFLIIHFDEKGNGSFLRIKEQGDAPESGGH